jgi:hypothetical protein
LTFPCYLTTFSGKKCLSGKVICAFFCPAYRSSPVYFIFPNFNDEVRRTLADSLSERHIDQSFYLTAFYDGVRVS